MINVRLYQEIVIPFFNIKHGQYAAIALTRSGANKLLRKVWKAFITCRGKIVAREHAKAIQNQKKFDIQLQTAQLPAGQKIDNRVNKKLVGLNAEVKSKIKDTVKSQFIKKEAVSFDPSLFDCELTYEEEQYPSSIPFPSSALSKRSRQSETVDLRSPVRSRRKKKQDFRPPYLHSQGFKCFIFIISKWNFLTKKSLVNLYVFIRSRKKP